VSDSATTVSQARVARLADVARATVTQWRKRHADFPAPVGGAGNRFLLGEVIDWLDQRPIPANRRRPDEAVGATYGSRVRRRLRTAPRPEADLLLREVLALGPEICGGAPQTDYLYLLLCLAFLRLHDQDRWAQLTRHVPSAADPGEARRLLRRVVATVDASLGYPHQLSGPDAPPTRLRPRAFEPVRKVFELTARLLPNDFDRLRAAYMRQVHVRDDAIYTPASITHTMVALLADHAAKGNATVYDPFARFGELLGGFFRGHADPAAVQVSAENPRAAELRLAGMWLAAAGAHAELAVTSSPPIEATCVLTNPPFGNKDEPAWLRRCIASLAEDGRAVVLMPYGAGFRSDAKAYDFRRELVENGAVLAVVALPAQMFPGTSIGVCIWLLQQPTGRAAPVQLVDARTLGRPPGTQKHDVHILNAADIATIATTVAASECRPGFSILVNPDEIRAHGYSLHPPEYQDRTLAPASAEAARAELDALFADSDPPSYMTGGDEGWPPRRLGDLCDIRAGVPHGSLKLAISKTHIAREAVPVVHPRHLRAGLIDARRARRRRFGAGAVPASSWRRALRPDWGHGPDRDRRYRRVGLAAAHQRAPTTRHRTSRARPRIPAGVPISASRASPHPGSICSICHYLDQHCHIR
jgi:type I restriction enzyme M protein